MLYCSTKVWLTQEYQDFCQVAGKMPEGKMVSFWANPYFARKQKGVSPARLRTMVTWFIPSHVMIKAENWKWSISISPEERIELLYLASGCSFKTGSASLGWLSRVRHSQLFASSSHSHNGDRLARLLRNSWCVFLKERPWVSNRAWGFSCDHVSSDQDKTCYKRSFRRFSGAHRHSRNCEGEGIYDFMWIPLCRKNSAL